MATRANQHAVLWTDQSLNNTFMKIILGLFVLF